MLTEFLKYASIGTIGFFIVGETYYGIMMYLKSKGFFEDKKSEENEEFNEIFFTGRELNYDSKLARNVKFQSEPSLHPTQLLEHIILSARYTIHLAMYIFTSEPLAQALIKASKSGVSVQLIVDKSMKNSSGSKIYNLTHYGIAVKIYESDTMHHKICLVDAPFKDSGDGKALEVVRVGRPKNVDRIQIPKHGLTLTGSLNWTRDALTSNQENFVATSNKEICAQTAAVFFELWNASIPL
jgi:phosphatidylserine/phosphatidylglycerophosphate/cardiolipin synthase-like enzyme